jgi:anti-sigma B factor antagonist
MDIKMNRNDSELTVALIGSLDTNSSPELDAQLKTALDGVTKLIFDMKELKYISSAGLRIMLITMQRMEAQGEMIVKNVCPEVMDVFEITGFIEDLTIENE